MSGCSPPSDVAKPTQVTGPKESDGSVSPGLGCDTHESYVSYEQQLKNASERYVESNILPKDLLEKATQISYHSRFSRAALYILNDGTRVAKTMPTVDDSYDYIDYLTLYKEFLAWNCLADLFANISDIPAYLQRKVYIPSKRYFELGMYKESPTLVLPKFTYTLGEFARYCLEEKETDEETMLARQELVCVLETIAKLYAFLHVKLGFIHGDLHSGNLMVTKVEGDWRITPIDFGESSMNSTTNEWETVTDLVHPRYTWKPAAELQLLRSHLQCKLLGMVPSGLLPSAEDLFQIFESYVHVLERPPKRQK